MRVTCPHCSAAYNIDDKRVPPSGVNVRCPKCRATFPVRRGEGEASTAVPLPGGHGPESVPLPGPAGAAASAALAAPPGPASFGEDEPFGAVTAPPPPDFGGSVPLPAPGFPSPAGDSPFGDSPFAAATVARPADPFAPAFDAPFAPPAPTPAADADAEPPFASAGDVDDAGQEPPFADPGAVDFAASDPEPFPAAPPEQPFGDPSGPGPLGFGEVDFGFSPSAASDPLPVPPDPGSVPDPFALPPPEPGDPFGSELPPPEPSPSRDAGSGDDLEMLFGEAPRGPAAGGGYKVRRRSGKIFGPFAEAQVADMLAKGELLGNEDVSSDDGATFKPIGAVPAFGDALREAIDAATPPAARGAASGVGVPFGDRMAAARVVEGQAPKRPLPKWAKPALAGAVALLVLGTGVGAGFTRHGFFFWNALRPGDAKAVAAALAEARAGLGRGDFTGERAAVESAARAVLADPRSVEAQVVHAAAVAAAELSHGAQAAELEQARAAAARLDADAKTEWPATAARLAVTLAATPGPATATDEARLEALLAREKPDAVTVGLLATAAWARRDAGRAEALYGRLAGMESGPRAAIGLARALALRGDLEGARARLAKVLEAVPGQRRAALELAALELAAGDAVAAGTRLEPLLQESALAALGPAERARALVLKGALLARRAADAEAADAAFGAALQADPRFLEARVALAGHRLRIGAAARAVEATDPIATTIATAPPELVAIRVRALALAGRALDASKLSEQALAATPGAPPLLAARAVALAAAGKPAEAAAAWKEALEREPAAVEPRVALARLALAAQDLPAAADLLTAAVEKGPRDASARSAQGDLAAARGDAAAAREAYEKALALDAEHAPAQLGLARLALAAGDQAAAREALEKALALDPRSADAHLAHGNLLRAAKDLPAAAAAFAKVVELQPRNALALARLCAVEVERGDAEAAVRYGTSATNEDSALAEARYWLGRALLARNEAKAAIVQLKKAAELAPKDPENLLQLGTALQKSGAPSEALEAWQAAAGVDPKLPDPWVRTGQLYADLDRCGEAVPAWEKALARAPGLTRVRLSLGECKARLGRHDDAVKIFREVLKSDPKAVEAIYLQARSIHESEGPKAAFPLYERAAKEDPKNARPHYYLGYAFKERGQRKRAVEEFRAFLSLEPEAAEKKDIEAEIEDLSTGR